MFKNGYLMMSGDWSNGLGGDYTAKPHIDYLILLADGDTGRQDCRAFKPRELAGSASKSSLIVIAQRDCVKNSGGSVP